MSLFLRRPSSSYNGLNVIFTLLIAIIVFEKLLIFPHSSVSFDFGHMNFLFWPHEFSSYSGKQHLHILSISPDFASTNWLTWNMYSYQNSWIAVTEIKSQYLPVTTARKQYPYSLILIVLSVQLPFCVFMRMAKLFHVFSCSERWNVACCLMWYKYLIGRHGIVFAFR